MDWPEAYGQGFELTEHSDAPPPGACCIGLGTFDGVHNGHITVLQRVRHHARRLGVEAAVMTFDPHPRTIVEGVDVLYLTAPRTRIARLKASGVDRVLVARFTSAVATADPVEFVSQLCQMVRPKVICVGEDFRFGYGRSGDVELLRELGSVAGFKVDAVPLFEQFGERVSSSRIRDAIARGDMDEAIALLGAPYRLDMSRVPDPSPMEAPYAIQETAECPPAGVYLSRIDRGRSSDRVLLDVSSDRACRVQSMAWRAGDECVSRSVESLSVEVLARL